MSSIKMLSVGTFQSSEEKEISFYEFMEAHLMDLRFSSKDVDAVEHWDVLGKVIDKKTGDLKDVRFDVKAIPTNSVPHKNGFRWVEIRNVRGDGGSLFGKADYIAFEEKDYWLIVDRAELLTHVMTYTHGWTSRKEFKVAPVPYRWHTRDNRDDIATLVPISELLKIGTRINKKQ